MSNSSDENLTQPTTEPQPIPAPELPSEKPLAAANRRFRRQAEAKRKGWDHLQEHPDIAVGMAAAGLSQAKIAKALSVPASVVSDHLEGAQDTILTIRDRLKLQKTIAMERVESRLWPRLERDVAKADAKDIDALSRAAMNLEKIQAQISGEGTNVNVRQTSDAPNVDLKILIQNLLGD